MIQALLTYKADSAIIKSFKSWHLELSEVQKFPYFVQLDQFCAYVKKMSRT